MKDGPDLQESVAGVVVVVDGVPVMDGFIVACRIVTEVEVGVESVRIEDAVEADDASTTDGTATAGCTALSCTASAREYSIDELKIESGRTCD